MCYAHLVLLIFSDYEYPEQRYGNFNQYSFMLCEQSRACVFFNQMIWWYVPQPCSIVCLENFKPMFILRRFLASSSTGVSLACTWFLRALQILPCSSQVVCKFSFLVLPCSFASIARAWCLVALYVSQFSGQFLHQDSACLHFLLIFPWIDQKLTAFYVFPCSSQMLWKFSPLMLPC